MGLREHRAAIRLDARLAPMPCIASVATTGPTCGALGQMCCPPAIGQSGFTTLPPGASDQQVRIAQGSRCVTGAICNPANNQCRACGGPGQPCCDMDMANLVNRQLFAGGTAPLPPTTPLQEQRNLLGLPPMTALVGSEFRRAPDTLEEQRCDPTPPASSWRAGGSAPPVFTPSRCNTAGFVCNGTPNGRNPASASAGTCVACGGPGQPCCDGQWCANSTGATGRLGCNGTCEACGGQCQPPCTACGQPQCDAGLGVVDNRCQRAVESGEC